LKWNAGEIFDPAEYVVWRRLPLYGQPQGWSAFRAAYSSWWMLTTAMTLRAQGCVNRAFPIIVGEYDVPSRLQQLEATLGLAASRSWMAIPTGVKVTALEVAGSGETYFKDFITDLRERIVIAIRGAFLQQMQGGQDKERGDSEVHEDAADLFVRFLQVSLCQVFNSRKHGLIRDFTDVNFSDVQQYHQLSFAKIDHGDLAKKLAVVVGLHRDLGLDLKKEEVYRAFGQEQPDAGDEGAVLKGAAPPGGGAPGGEKPPPGGSPGQFGDDGGKAVAFSNPEGVNQWKGGGGGGKQSAVAYKITEKGGKVYLQSGKAEHGPFDSKYEANVWAQKQDRARNQSAAKAASSPGMGFVEDEEEGRDTPTQSPFPSPENGPTTSPEGPAPLADQTALAGADGAKVVSLLASSQRQGAAVIGQLAGQAIRRYLAGKRQGSRLFNDQEQLVLVRMLAGVNGTAELLGRARVRLRAKAAQSFAEDASGHEHKGKGPGGGQFTKQDGGKGGGEEGGRFGSGVAVSVAAADRPHHNDEKTKLTDAELNKAVSDPKELDRLRRDLIWVDSVAKLNQLVNPNAASPAEQAGLLLPVTPKESKELASVVRKGAVNSYGKDLRNRCGDVSGNLFNIFGKHAEIWSGIYPGPHQEGGFHKICKVGDYFIDVTADQFGGDKINVMTAKQIAESPLYSGFRRDPNAEKVATETSSPKRAAMGAAGLYQQTKPTSSLLESNKKNLTDNFVETAATANYYSSFSDSPTPFTCFDESPGLHPMSPWRAVAFFRRLVPSLRTDAEDFRTAQERAAYKLAVTTDREILDRVHNVVAKRLETGEGVSTAPQDISDILDSVGITPRNPQYAEMVVRTGLMNAYSAGAHEEQRAVADTFPVWRWDGIEDGRERPRHRRHFGKYFPASVSLAEVRDKEGYDGYNERCSSTPIYFKDWERLKSQGARIADGYAEDVQGFAESQVAKFAFSPDQQRGPDGRFVSSGGAKAASQAAHQEGRKHLASAAHIAHSRYPDATSPEQHEQLQDLADESHSLTRSQAGTAEERRDAAKNLSAFATDLLTKLQSSKASRSDIAATKAIVGRATKAHEALSQAIQAKAEYPDLRKGERKAEKVKARQERKDKAVAAKETAQAKREAVKAARLEQRAQAKAARGAAKTADRQQRQKERTATRQERNQATTHDSLKSTMFQMPVGMEGKVGRLAAQLHFGLSAVTPEKLANATPAQKRMAYHNVALDAGYLGQLLATQDTSRMDGEQKAERLKALQVVREVGRQAVNARNRVSV